MKGYRDLIAWQKAMDLAVEIYKVTEGFPRHEQYALTAQMHRAAISIPSNLAEGQGRNSRREFHQFIGQARGSIWELETQVELAFRLGYIPTDRAPALLERLAELARIVTGLREWSNRPIASD